MAKQKRGFAAMDPEKQREIASKGGRSSHAGFAHMDPEKQREIARKGGQSRGKKRQETEESSDME